MFVISKKCIRHFLLGGVYLIGFLGVIASGGGGGSGGGSDPIPATPPIAPSGLIATATSSNNIRLSWTNNSNEQDSEQNACLAVKSDGVASA